MVAKTLQIVFKRLMRRLRSFHVKKFIQQSIGRKKQDEYTKMVKGVQKRSKSFIENDPLRIRMLQERQENARRQSHDYSHVFRKKSRMELIRLSLIITGIEFAYSAETAFVSPILLSIGLEHQHMTMVWAISPLIAFFVSPILGSVSDRCHSRFGRRRPFIFILSIGLLLGLILAPWGRDLGRMLGDNGVSPITNSSSSGDSGEPVTKLNRNSGGSFYWAIFFTVLGTMLLDFNADNCQNPSRAYLLDVCLPEEHAHALSTFTIMAGSGGCLGYALGAINWDQTIFANIIGDNIKTVFTIVTVIFLCTVFITMTSFREIPLKKLESDELLHPVTQMAVKKEREKLKSIDTSKLPSTSSIAFETDKIHQLSSEKIENSRSALTGESREASNGSLNSSSDDDEDEADETITMMMYLKSIVFMPKSMRILCFTNCISWMGHILYCLYFTDFVGEVVFGGDPAAATNSPEYQLYDQGIRFGCWGLAVYALSCAFYSMIIENLIKKFSTKVVYVGGLLSFSISMAILGHYPSKLGVLLFSMAAGIIYATLFTIPYLLVAQYHAKGFFKLKKPNEANNNLAKVEESMTPGFERGMATDCGIIGSMMFVAQFTMSLSIGTLITLLDSVSAVLYAASFFSFLASISALFVVYMDH